MLNIFKEPFIGKYDGVTSPLLLPQGWISDGLNMRKISPVGGWKVRKGCELHNTTAVDSTNGVESLHQYTHPIHGDYHFIAQCNSLLYDATTDPPTKGTTFGTSLGVTVGTTPGFSCMVGDWWIYADGSGTPIIYGGDTARVLGFFQSFEATTTTCAEFTKEVSDSDTSTYAVITPGADDLFYLVTTERISGATFDLGDVNSNAVDIQIHAMRSGTWTVVSGASDGTQTGGDTTLAQDGTVSWTASASDTLYCINRTMGYCYRFTWSGALSGNITIKSCTVTQAAATITNKWNGAYETATGAIFYDASATDKYKEALGYVSNESPASYIDLGAGTTSDALIAGTPEPATGFLVGIVKDYANVNNAQWDEVTYWDGDSNVSVTTGLVDTSITSGGTNGFGQTGTFYFDGASITSIPRSIGFSRVMMHWYYLKWDATLSANCRVYFLGYIPLPKPIGTYSGCVEFKGRLILWGDLQYPNRLRYSALDRPDTFCGIDSSWSQAFGAGDVVKCCLNFYNELLIWKANSIWMWEGFDRATFGSLRITNKVGLASPKTAKVVEVGTPGMSTLEPRSIAIWQDTDGVYVIDGDKPKKVSMPIDHFFNPEYSTCIPAADIESLQACVDPIRNTYHLLLPNNIDYYGDTSLYVNELVYNYATDEWYPPWYRNLKLSCGISLKGTDNRDYAYGATDAGWIMKLESDTTDKNISDADVAIDHRIKTRGIAATQEHSSTTRIRMRHLWPEFKSRSAGTPIINFYPDLADTGTSLGTVSMINSGYALANPAVPLSTECQGCFQTELTLNVVDQEMEIWSLTYEHEVKGLSNL